MLGLKDWNSSVEYDRVPPLRDRVFLRPFSSSVNSDPSTSGSAGSPMQEPEIVANLVKESFRRYVLLLIWYEVVQELLERRCREVSSPWV